MKMVYISHPYTGNEEENKADADRIKEELQYDNPEENYISPLGMFGEPDKTVGGYCTSLARCLELLSRCDEVVFCEGWEKSTGCRAELAFALQHGIATDFLGANPFEEVAQ